MAKYNYSDRIRKKYGAEEKAAEPSKPAASVETSKNKSGSSDKYRLSNEIRSKYSTDYTTVSVDSFLKKSDDFFNSVAGSFQGLGYKNAAATAASRRKQAQDLRRESLDVMRFLEKNRDFVDDNTYNALAKYISNFGYETAKITDVFDEAEKFYRQFANEGEYNKWKKDTEEYEALLNHDTVKGEKEIEDLEKLLKEYRGLSRTMIDENMEKRLEYIRQNYGEEKDIKNLISQKEAYNTQAKRLQEGVRLGSVGNKDSEYYDPEYAYWANKRDNLPTRDDLVAYDSMMDQSKWYTDSNGKLYDAYGTEIDPYNTDGKGKILHPSQGSVDSSDKLGIYLSASEEDVEEASGTYLSTGGTWETIVAEGSQRHWDRMEEAEINTYYYYLNKEGSEAAEKYLDSIQETLNRREGTDMSLAMKDKTALELLFMAAVGLDQWGSGAQGLRNAITGNDEYIPVSATQFAGSLVQEDLGTVGPKLPDWLGGGTVAQAAGDLISTTANMLPSILTSVAVNAIAPGAGVAVGTGLLSASAAGNAYTEMINFGYDKEQARTYAAMVGASEAVLQSLLGGISRLGGGVINSGITKLLGKADNVLAKIAIQFGNSTLGKVIINSIEEGSEEYLQAILEPWFKNIVFGEENEIDLLSEEALYSALLGALTGGVFEGSDVALNKANTNAMLRDTGNAIIGADGGVDALKALAMDVSGAKLTKQANKVSSEPATGKGLAGKVVAAVKNSSNQKKVGKLYQSVEAEVTSQNQADIAKALNENGFSKSSANNIAEAVVAKINGVELNRFQESVLESVKDNKMVDETVNKIINDPESGVAKRTGNLDTYSVGIMLGKGIGPEATREAQKTTLKVSEDGKTTANGKEIQVEFADNGLLATEDGTVAVSDVEYSSATEAYVVETIANLGLKADAANALLRTANAKNMNELQAQAFATGLKVAYRMGRIGNLAELNKNYFTSKLTAEQRKTAYTAGLRERNAEVAARQTAINEAKQKAEEILAAKSEPIDKKGKVIFEDGISEKALHPKKKAAYLVARKVSSTMGNDIHLYNGKVEYGFYDAETGDVWLNINASASGKDLMLFTLSHEIVHHANEWSPEEFTAFADFLLEAYGEKGKSVEQMIKKQIDKAKSHGITLTREGAYEEVICDACERMLIDSNALEKLSLLEESNPGIIEKIKALLQKFLAKIREMFKDVEPNTNEAIYLSEMEESVKALLYEKFENLMVGTAKTYSTIRAAYGKDVKAVPNYEIITNGAVTIEGDGKKYSIKSMKHDIAEGKMFEDLRTVCGWTEAETAALKDQLEQIVAYMTPFRDIVDMKETSGRDSRRFSPYKPNSDPLYTISMDFSTLCSKRLLTQYVIENLQLRENRPMSAEEQIAIRDMLIEYRQQEKALQVACAMCYVEAARLKSPKQMERWLNDPASLMRNYFATQNPEFKQKIKNAQADFKESRGYERNATKKEMKQKDVTELNKIGPRMYTEYIPSAEEQAIIDKAVTLPNSTYLTAGNLSDLSESDPIIYKAYTSFVRTATRSKGLEQDIAYYYGDSTRDNGNGIIVSDNFIESVNQENGMRFSSWSDWRIEHLLDYITAVIDNSVRGAAMHGYTKFPDEVRVLGKTGMMFNMSGVAGTQTGLNEDGSLSFSETESINFEEAKALREEFPETAGLQCIGVGDEHIRQLLRSDIIDYVIPYHTSGLNAVLRRMVNIHGWKDYTGTQHATPDKSISKENAKDAENWHKEPVFSEFFVGYNTGMTGVEAMKKSAENYKQMCRERGLTPKFAQFMDEDGYWKLLIDRKMVNNKTGKLIQQNPVKPVFDTETIKGIVDKYVDNYDSGLQSKALNYIVENWDSLPARIKDLKKAKKSKAKKALDTLANETVAAQPGRKFALPEVSQDGIDLEPGETMYSTGSTGKTSVLKVNDKDIFLSEDQMMRNIRDVAYMKPVKQIDKSKLDDSGQDVKKQYRDHFSDWGNVIHSDLFGDIEVGNPSVKSDFAHGTTAAKIASIEAIPEVIKKGKIINWFVKDRSVYRITVAAPIRIGSDQYYMGVMLKRDANSQRLYLHDVVIEKEASSSSAGYPSTTGAGKKKKNLSMSNLLEDILFVKSKEKLNSEYMDAISRGDMDTAQRLVDIAARISGYITVTRFHQTASIFTQFSTDHPVAGLNDSETPNGIFFKSNDHDIGIGGNIQMKMYLKAGNMLHFANRKEANAWYCQNVPGYDALQKELEKALKPFLDKLDAIEEQQFDPSKSDEEVDALFEEEGRVIEEMDKVEKSYRAKLRKLLDQYFLHGKSGYDGIELDYDGHRWVNGKREDVHTFIVFDRNQAKSAEPVTYDDNGEVIPLHYRFSRSRSDIRYSLPTSGDISARTLLANAFEGVAQHDIEREKLSEYKAKISFVNAEEQRLREINAKLFQSKTPLTKKERSDLQDEAVKLRNQITIYDAQLLRLEASKPLQNVLNREKAKVRKQMKEQAKKDIREAKLEEQQRFKNRVASHEKVEMRKKIRKTIRDLDKILNHGNKKQNVKDDMKGLVASAIQSAEVLFTENYTNEDIIQNGFGVQLGAAEQKHFVEAQKILEQMFNLGTGYEAMVEREKLKNKLSYRMAQLRDAFFRERNRLNETRVSEVLGNLADAYSSLETSEYLYIKDAYHASVHEYLKYLQNEVGGTTVRNMNMSQLENLHKAYTMVLETVRNANKMFNENLKEGRDQLANAIMREVRMVGGEHGDWTKLGIKRNKFSWNNMKPIYAAERIGSETFSRVVSGLFEGQYKWATNMEKARAFQVETAQKYGVNNWDMEKAFKFTSSNDLDFTLNLEQILALYAYSKREAAHDHITNGGIVFGKNTEVIENKNGIKIHKLKRSATTYSISDELLGEIISKLDDTQKKYVDEMQKYLSETMGGLGNEVSMRLYGVKLFGEENYFPLKSAGQYMEKAREADLQKQQGHTSLVNSGFTHAVKPHAKNPIVLDGFIDVWAGHVNEMAMYNGMVLPMEDFRKVYNYHTPFGDGSTSVNGVIENAYGAEATSYFDQLYQELNSGAVSDPRETDMLKWVGKFKKAAVMASMSVVVQQPSAIGRAFALIDPKYFVGQRISESDSKKQWDEVKKYAPVAIIKEMGGFDTHTGTGAKDFLLAKEYSKDEIGKALLKDKDYRKETADMIMGYLPAKADEITWVAIWQAVKREVKAKNPNLHGEEFLKKAGSRFSEVIEKTQVYDSVLAKSANMRAKTGLITMATAFMAEPTTTINMIENAFHSKKNVGRVLASVAVSIILNNLLASAIYAMRDDDEDETFLEKYAQAFTSGMVDDLNPLTYYPFLKDIWSVFQGYDVERSDMSAISDVSDALKKVIQFLSKDTSEMDEDELAEHHKEGWSAAMSLADGAFSALGVPFKNLRREVESWINTYRTTNNGLSNNSTSLLKTIAASAVDALPVASYIWKSEKSDNLYDAIINGNTAYEERLRSEYEDEKAVKTAMRSAVKDHFLAGDIDSETALQYLVSYCGDDEDEAFWKVEEWTYNQQTEDAFSKYNEFYGAVQTGKDLKAIIKKYTDNGVTESTLKSQISEHFKKEYIEMSTTERSSIKGYLLNAMTLLGDDREDAEKRISGWEFEANSGFNYEDRRELYLKGEITGDQVRDAVMTFGGKTEEEADKEVEKLLFEAEYGFAYSDIADAYKSGKISAEVLKHILMTAGGKTAEEADLQVQAYDWGAEGYEDVTSAAVREYAEYCASANVPKDVYLHIRSFSNNTSNDVDANGKTIYYSAMKKIMAEINAQYGLTNAQKDALARSMGWAEKNIQKYKLW